MSLNISNISSLFGARVQPHARAVTTRGSSLMSMMFTAALERVDMRLLRVIVVILRFRPSIHGVACEYQYNKGGKKGIAKRSVSRLLVLGA